MEKLIPQVVVSGLHHGEANTSGIVSGLRQRGEAEGTGAARETTALCDRELLDGGEGGVAESASLAARHAPALHRHR